MAFSTQEATAGKYLPFIGGIVIVVTIVTCFSVAKAEDIYLGGLSWPYFSDIGRDSPGYYVFAIGLTSVGIMFAYLWHLNYKVQVSLLKAKGMKICLAKKTRFLGILSNIFLPILSIFDTANYATLHILSAYAFVAMQILTTSLNIRTSKKIVNAMKGDESVHGKSVRRVYTWQLIFLVVFWIAFLFYIPIGLAITCSFERLSLDDCLSMDLGDTYCKEDLRLNDTHTLLWDYSGCRGNNHMRSVSQLIVILSLIGYATSFSQHRYEEPEAAQGLAPPITQA